jgi:hypothetical protein
MKVYQFDFPTNSSFSFTHLVNKVYHKIHILYNSADDDYYINVDKFVNGKFENIINSIKLTTGVNLFLQFSYMNLGTFCVIPKTDKLYRNVPKASTIVDGYAIFWEHE